MKPSETSKMYRLSTLLRAFKKVCQLSPQQVEDYLKACEVYNYEWVDGRAMDDLNPVSYSEVKNKIVNWYQVVNQLCAIGLVEKMYIPPNMDPAETVINNQLLYEKKMCQWLDAKPGYKLLDVGCGRGRVGANIASTSGAHITGINIDETQLESAINFSKKNGLSSQCTFIKADLNDIPYPFADNQFNGLYLLQVISLSRDLEQFFKEANRVLKVGGKILLSEWACLPNYDERNPHHRDLMRRIKPLVGAIGNPTPAFYESALRKAGFNILSSFDPSMIRSDDVMVEKAGKYYDKLLPFINLLVKFKLIPKHIITLFDQFGKNAEALCEAIQLRLVALNYQILAEKQ